MTSNLKSLEHDYKGNPTPSATERLANAYIEAKQLNDALEILEDQIPNYPQNIFLHRLYADVLRLTGNFDKALVEYQKVTGKTGNDPHAWFGLATTHVSRGEWVQALDCYRQVIEHRPMHLEAWQGIQKCQQMLSQPTTGSQQFGVNTATMAEIYEQQGLYTKALEIYLELVKLNPTYQDKINLLQDKVKQNNV